MSGHKQGKENHRAKMKYHSTMIILLDIDGVLNQLQGNYYIDKNCVRELSIICKELNADIVLTSSWRIGYVNVGKCTPQIEELKSIAKDNNINIIGRTRDLGNRSSEITTYIKEHEVSKYIIIDDDESEISSELHERAYFINCRTGITHKDVKNIIRRFGRWYQHVSNE